MNMTYWYQSINVMASRINHRDLDEHVTNDNIKCDPFSPQKKEKKGRKSIVLLFRILAPYDSTHNAV